MKHTRPFEIGMRVLVLAVLLVAGTSSSFAQTPGGGGGESLSASAGQAAAPAPALGAPPLIGSGIVTKQAMEFEPFLPSATLNHYVTWVYNTSTTTGYYIEGWLNLPHRAQVKNFVVYFYDADPDRNISANLWFFPKNGVNVTNMATVASSGSAGYGYAQDTTIDNAVVDLTSGALVAEVYLPPTADIRLGIVRVDYGYDTMLPSIFK